MAAADVSPREVDLTRANGQATGVSMPVFVSNLFDAVRGTFDVIAFNPPMRPDESETSRLLTSVLRRSPRLSHLLMLLVGDRFESNRTDFLRSVVAESSRRPNPVGRLVLRIGGYRDEATDRPSDALCTALQLANFWQDFALDWRRGRLYVPEAQWTASGARPRPPPLAGPPWVRMLCGWVARC